MPHAYVRQIYCFPTTNSQAVSALSRGLSGLAQDVPYILSQVVSDKSGTGSGVVISTPCHNVEDIFSSHDLSASINYATLKAGCFAPGAFQTHEMVPPGSLPPYPVSPAVFLARASLVNGGLILCVAVHHIVTDITGYDAILKIWAAHCRDGSSRNIRFDPSWMNRDPLFSELESSPDLASMPDLLHTITPEEPVRAAGRSQAVGTGRKYYQTAIFYFPQQHLRVLKDDVNEYIASQEPESWVSTSNILASLLWSAIIEAQDHSYLDTNKVVTAEDTRISTLSFPVQFRPVLRPPLPQDFLGAAFLMTNARLPHKDVRLISYNSKSTARGQEPKPAPQVGAGADVPANSVDIPVLAEVALAIRRSIQRIDDAAVRGVLAYLEAHPGTNPEAPIILGPPRYDAGGSGTSVVSWANQCVYELNWGGAVGRCDAVRLPKMGNKRDPIVLPRMPSFDGHEGGLEVIMSYEVNVMKRLIEGPVMRRFAALRCLS
ncbi:hypothetical protein E0Z10_g7262 [Xylaria hypoxylon]|uniref:Trichothecene 3-O-acetyltransferase-like N-terminal domain-containing protein n=1 Tax=Xylaria hypoxylon TaxID=37992 RepID=A0A4Z0YR30_9PEZI|nr:hypothetical protein E0Z10_g7262 [Xylaria hypoxylon]